jgi:LysM repeat protein
MEDYRPNQIARTFAVCALVGAFILVIIVIAGNGGSSDSGGNGGSQTSESSGPTAAGQHAVQQGVWVVRSGDTLAQISEDTGIDVDQLLQMNPDLDPQALIEGQRISLR